MVNLTVEDIVYGRSDCGRNSMDKVSVDHIVVDDETYFPLTYACKLLSAPANPWKPLLALISPYQPLAALGSPWQPLAVPCGQ